MQETMSKIGPADHGRRMTLEEFDQAEAPEGVLYELARGQIIVTKIPDPRHFDQVYALKRQLFAYDIAHPGNIERIGTGSECKILLDDLESERHPDLLVYKKSRPAGKDVWRLWVPEIVIEVVSPSSAHRDYEEKPEEYLRFGVTEYWIMDADKGEAGEMLALTRTAGRWVPRVVRGPERYSTWVLPGFELDVAAVFAAAK